ncbi:MAG: VWA domain-containing protein [Thiogranum sp.]|jgi:Ca-activated chloride channel family protein
MGMRDYQWLVFPLVTVLVAGACTVDSSDPAAQRGSAGKVEEEARTPPPAAPADAVAGRQAAPEARPAAAALRAKSSVAAREYGLAAHLADLRAPSEPVDRERYAHFTDSPLQRVAEQPFSTFSIDVDTGAYSNVRRMLNAGRRPVRDAVRTEELINYFSYDYPRPTNRNRPFSITTEVGPTPWNPDTRLLHIGIQGYEVPRDQLPPANLVFLVDVSGSMQSPDKLELLKSALRLLVGELNADDRISLAVYAGASGVVLEPTPGDQSAKILAALDTLTAGGSTNGGAGIRLAYALAQQALIKDGINRVILATDGDFNVGTVDFERLKQLVEDRRGQGIGLTTLGFGTGNYNDQLMEQLADAGNGNYAYIDTLSEARKALVDEMSSTLLTIAKDVKIQVEFNPATVAEYRLIGYENRALAREDFSNDKVDAGDIGAGHSVTAIYEIALTGSAGQRLGDSRYQPSPKATHNAGELALVRVRYKRPGTETSALVEQPVRKADIVAHLDRTSGQYRFAAAVAGFGQILRGGKYTGQFSYPEVLGLARAARGDDPFGYRGEFLQLVNLASSL